MSLFTRLMTPKKVKEAAEQMLAALINAPRGSLSAIELPTRADNAEEAKEMIQVATYLLHEKGDHLTVQHTSTSILIQLRKDFAKHSPQGRRALIEGGFVAETADKHQIEAAISRLRNERG
jgi:lipopolysaccharide biosynthesis regulator YciM